MNLQRNLVAKQLFPDDKLKRNDQWFEKCAEFLPKLSSFLEEELTDEDRIEYSDRCVKYLTRLAFFTYLARKERDNALATGYEKYPKGQYNSDASTALARNHASSEVSLRELLAELETALKLRASLNQSAISHHRVILSNAG